MQTIYIILGAIAGAWLGGSGRIALGLCVGAVIGYLIAKQRLANEKLAALEKDIEQLAARPAPAAAPAARAAVKPPVSLYERDEPVAAPAQRAPGKPAPAAPQPAKPAASMPPLPPPPPNPLEKLFDKAKSWITTGNVPVKIGVIVSFFGVAFLLKYAVEHQVLVVPIELRYLAVAIAAGVLLALGWRWRTRLRVYALSLQGGGIGILYLTIFAAFRVHPLLPAPFAFALLVLLTAGAGTR
jgi:uncharacterized membrane protein